MIPVRLLQVRFVDDNTRMPWEPVTGGSNVPAINDFLHPAFGMALGGTVMDGVLDLPGGKVCISPVLILTDLRFSEQNCVLRPGLFL